MKKSSVSISASMLFFAVSMATLSATVVARCHPTSLAE